MIRNKNKEIPKGGVSRAWKGRRVHVRERANTDTMYKCKCLWWWWWCCSFFPQAQKERLNLGNNLSYEILDHLRRGHRLNALAGEGTSTDTTLQRCNFFNGEGTNVTVVVKLFSIELIIQVRHCYAVIVYS